MLSDGAATRFRPVAAGVALVVAIGYSWVAGHFTTFTRPAEVATFIPGALGVVAAIGMTPRATSRPGRSGHGWAVWWLLLVGFNAIELASLALGANHSHPTVSDLVNPWLLSTPSRAVGFGLWLSIGYWLVKR